MTKENLAELGKYNKRGILPSLRCHILGLLWWLSDKEFAWQCRRCGFNPWFRKIPGEELFLGGKSHGLRSLACCSSWGHKELAATEWTELNWTEQLNNNIMSSDSRLDGMPCVLRDEGPTGEWKQGGRCYWKERAWNVLVVKRNACVGVWEGIRGNEHCQVDLYFNYQSIPRTFFQDAGIREMASFNNMFVHYKYKD